MKYSLAVLSLCVFSWAASASILPDAIGAYHATGSSKPALQDVPIWNDYGLKAAETSTYENGSAKLTATVWELGDTTDSLAAFDWQRPADAKPSKLGPLAAETANSLLWVRGQYLFRFDGDKPSAGDLEALAARLPKVDLTPIPVLASYLPTGGLIPNSERYITGPASLARFAPGIGRYQAGLLQSGEGQSGVFHSPKGDFHMVIFNYPTPQIAMDRLSDFQKMAGAIARRSGPFVAVTVAPPDPDFAEKLLGEIQYQAQITRDEYVPTRRDNMGNLLLNICILIGILAAFALVSGLVFGGLRYLARVVRKGPEPEAMITLHLE